MRRAIVITVVAAVFVTASFGAAASLGIGAGGLAAGSGAVARCHTTADAPTFDRVLSEDETQVTHIAVTGLDDVCTGGELTLTVLDGADAVATSVTSTVPTQPQPPAPDVFEVDITDLDPELVVRIEAVIVGPQP